jgi:Leucine-rich repeat (LRR) protein
MRRYLIAGLLLIAGSARAAIPASERDALVAIYQSTNGAAWTDKTNWLGAVGTECTWYGVGCDETQANVVDLGLHANNLHGTLPEAIRNLTKLRAAQIWSNDLQGPLPSELGELSNLEALYAERNHFTGTIPPSFAGLKKLVHLSLDDNELSGPLSAEVGGMSALVHLGLTSNRFSGAIPPALAQLTNLEELELTANQLTGEIPIALGSMTKLTELQLADNQLTGAIPPQLGNLAALVRLGLEFNKLTGTLPATLGQLHVLEQLDVEANILTGTIPDAIGDLTALQQLDLAANQFSGSLPTALSRLTNLEELQLGANQFSGPIPLQLADLHKLRLLHLYDNHLSGSIPTELSHISTLTSIGLQRNALTGTIPSELSGLPDLTALDLSGNQLTGAIPPQLGVLPKLEVLSLYDNALTGTIPRELGQLANLRELHLASNDLQGAIPDNLRNLTRLERFSVNENRLTGPIPVWIGEWTHLTELFAGDNQFSGPLPPGLSTLQNLLFLDLGQNELTGRFVDFTRMTKVVYITAQANHFSGPLPASIGLLSNLTYASLGSNDFSGPIPPELGGLANVELLDLTANDFDGPIPKELGNLKKAYSISLWGNHLSGTIPKELGALTQLQFLDLSFNALKGPIPPELAGMTGLEDHRSDFSFNGLYANDPNTRAFVNLKQYDGDFEATQTVMPANVHVAATTDRSATLEWDPIRYSYYGGGYQVTASTTPNGAPVTIATTSSKSLDTLTVRNLQPSTTYYFTVATVSHPISGQENLITSERTAPVQASTKQRTIAPADVVMTDAPNGMVRIDGAEVQGDSFTLTNFGDVATNLTLSRNENFFTIAPEQFSLAAGASQVVTVHSTSQVPGTYYGYVAIDGNGVPEDLLAEIILLASTSPSGTVVATPLSTRIELAGAPGSDEVGTAQFRNSGTARLTGIVLSDQPWVEVDAEPITIDPGSIGSVNFRVVRSKRPTVEGALTANLSLVYVSGNASAATIAVLGTTGTVSISKVTIVDVTQPSLVSGKIPPLAPGEVPFFIPGLTGSATQHTDLSIINATGAQTIGDLRLYFTGTTQTRIAALQPLGFAQSVNLVNLLGSVYGTEGGGTIQLRTADTASIAAGAKVTSVTGAGTFTGTIPVFRGDRSALAGEKIFLTGLTQGGDLFVQETGGTAGIVGIEFLDAAGGTIGSRGETVGAYALVELFNAIPANAVTAIVTNGGPSLLTAYARLHDAHGDSWSVVDWSRFYGYARGDTMRVPFADGRGGTTRRRATRHDAPGSEAVAPRHTTDLALFNPTTAEARATLRVIDTTGRVSDRSVTVPARATVTVNDVAALAGSTIANVLVEPGRGGQLAVTARTRDASGGSAVPVVSASAGLRLGQSQVYSGLDDSAALHTGYGFAETGGSGVKVLARIIISQTTSLVSLVTERTFTLAPREQIYLPELLRSFAGSLRDTAFGDLHGLVLEIEVIEGNGAVVPYVMATDMGTEDVSVTVQ